MLKPVVAKHPHRFAPGCGRTGNIFTELWRAKIDAMVPDLSTMMIFRPASRFLQKVRHISWQDRFLLTEALVLLAIVTPAIQLLPFRYIGRLAALPIKDCVVEPQPREPLIARVRWAVEKCSERVPWRAVCFQQGLAAQLMLRRRGVASTLYFGAAPDRVKGLMAHVWVRAGDIDVIGTENASDYAMLPSFPGPK